MRTIEVIGTPVKEDKSKEIETLDFISVTIDLEFKTLIPPFTEEERRQLETNLLEQGCREPLVVWKRHAVLLDGHNRYQLCTRHDISFQAIELELPDREAAINWIINNQLGRRNLTPESISYLRGKKYNLQKQQGKRKDLTCGQSDHKLKSAAQIADQHKVGERTIRRDAKYAAAVDTLANVVGFQVRPSLLSKDYKLTKKDTLELAQKATLEPEVVQEAFAQEAKDIVQRVKGRTRIPINFRAGEICQVIAKGNPELRGKGGCWCIVLDINEFSLSISIKGRQCLVKPENLKSTDLNSQQQAEYKRVCDRIASLYPKCADEPLAIAVLDKWFHENRYWLSPLEEKMLSILEQH